MFWRNKFFVMLMLNVQLAVGIFASNHVSSIQCQDPFYPLYIDDPRNDYEQSLSKKTKEESDTPAQIQMVVCDDDPWVMFNGIIYREGDQYMNGIITKITCTEVVVTNENSQTTTRLVDSGLIEKVGEKND